MSASLVGIWVNRRVFIQQGWPSKITGLRVGRQATFPNLKWWAGSLPSQDPRLKREGFSRNLKWPLEPLTLSVFYLVLWSHRTRTPCVPLYGVAEGL